MFELGVVYRNITRADRAAADGLATLGSATVHEAMGRVGLLKPYMRPIYGGQQVAEEAVFVVGGAGSHRHVAGLQLLGRHVHHPVVAGLQQHGDGRAADLGAAVDRAHIGLHQADAAHGFVDGGHAEFGQALYRSLVGAHDIAFDDAEVVHGDAHKNLLIGCYWFLALRAASRRGNTRRALPS